MVWWSAVAWCAANDGRAATYADLRYDGGCSVEFATEAVSFSRCTTDGKSVELLGHKKKDFAKFDPLGVYYWLAETADELPLSLTPYSGVIETDSKTSDSLYALCVDG